MSMVTLSTSWGISTLISRYTSRMATASASRMLANRRMPAAFLTCFLGNAFCHPAWSALSIQLITGVSR